jgi:UDP-2,3-diacylglucosamine hydrolase
MSTLFISDLHLSPERPDMVALFLEFMANQVQDSEALYILGDLFEVWVGDDYCPEELNLALLALKNYSDTGKNLFVLHGNRDFLMGENFEKLTGCQLLPDPSIIDLHGTQTLITHGDELCIDDVEYMKFRDLVRDKNWQQEFLAKPIEERIEFAKKARAESSMKTQQKPMDLMDVNQDAVEQLMLKHNVNLMIHGHTHRLNTHKFNVGDKSMTRIVLGDWYKKGSVLICTGDKQAHQSIS